MKQIKKGNVLITLGSLSSAILSIYYIIWNNDLYINGLLNRGDYRLLQAWFWIFTILNCLNIVALILSKYREFNPNLMSYFIISPFIMTTLTSLAILNIFTVTDFIFYLDEPFWIETYLIFLIIFEIMLFLGGFIISREQNG